MPRQTKPKPPKHCVIDLSGPLTVDFFDSVRDAKALAETNVNFVACSLAAHPKKGDKKKPAKPPAAKSKMLGLRLL